MGDDRRHRGNVSRPDSPPIPCCFTFKPSRMRNKASGSKPRRRPYRRFASKPEGEDLDARLTRSVLASSAFAQQRPIRLGTP